MHMEVGSQKMPNFVFLSGEILRNLSGHNDRNLAFGPPNVSGFRNLTSQVPLAASKTVGEHQEYSNHAENCYNLLYSKMIKSKQLLSGCSMYRPSWLNRCATQAPRAGGPSTLRHVHHEVPHFSRIFYHKTPCAACSSRKCFFTCLWLGYRHQCGCSSWSSQPTGRGTGFF